MSPGPVRIGVLACSCWSRSETGIDADSIVAGSLGLPGVVHAEATDDLCGGDHATLAGDLVRRHDLHRLVVAGCACCSQDQRCAACNDERAALRGEVRAATGLPWTHHAFVNVKDHSRGTQDSITAVAMAVASLAEADDEETNRASAVPVRMALVIGAGSLARAAAIELGERGVPTHMVDHASPAGTGKSTPRNITIHVPARVERLKGGGGRFTATIVGLGSTQDREVGTVIIAPGLAEEQAHGGVGWGLPHQTMAEPPRRVQGVFLLGEDPISTAGAAAAFLGRTVRGAEAMARVDPEACIGCMKCVRVCPYSAIDAEDRALDSEPAGPMDHVVRVDPLLCTGCGACPSACLNWAVEVQGYSTRQLEASIRAAMERTSGLLIVCNWSAYRAMDQAALDGNLPEGIAILRVPCISRVSPHVIQVALGAEADPLILAGCSERGCHYRGRRSLLDEHMRNMERGLLDSGHLDAVFVLTLGPADKEVLASRLAEAMEERRYILEERRHGMGSGDAETSPGGGWGE
jgi:coenzyme F420-reducing hydrogenase delta subunit/NAD-dependent dihydropyrimidine dehydrogenase PreA subunit